MGLLTITGNRFQLARSNYHFTLNIKTRNAGVGRYLCYLLDVTVTVLLIALSLRFLLPNTFSSLYEGLDAWTELSRGPIDSSLLINAASIFTDLIINHLILGGLKENAIFFILFAFLLIFNFSLILPETQRSNRLGAFLSIFKVALIIALFNIAFALFCNLYLKNDLLYTQLSSTVNYFGMVMIFGMLLAIIGVILYTAIGIICGIIRGIWRFISKPVR